MVIPGQAKKEVSRIESNKSKNLLLPVTSLVSVESLLMPLSLSLFCVFSSCRLLSGVSIRFWCFVFCLLRAGPRMNETDSVLVNVLEKKVTLTCRYPGIVKLPSRQVTVVYRNPVSTMAMIKRIFCSSLS